MKIETKKDRRERIRLRLRKKLSGEAVRPRVAVFRSVAHIYVQAIDDASGTTVASASTTEAAVKGQLAEGERELFHSFLRDQNLDDLLERPPLAKADARSST